MAQEVQLNGKAPLAKPRPLRFQRWMRAFDAGAMKHFVPDEDVEPSVDLCKNLLKLAIV